MEDPEFTDFWRLFGYRDAITPEIQRAALSAKVFYPSELYYHAPEDVNTIGGFANWAQDAEYATCPHCGKPMKYLAQIQWDTMLDGTEGTLYIEFCPDCHIASMQHQQT